MDATRRSRGDAASSRPAEAGPPEPQAPTRSLDRIGRRIVHDLQRDATPSLAHLADTVGLSQTPCRRLVQRLEQTGVLTGRVALAVPLRLDRGLSVFVSVTAPDHGGAWRVVFARVTAALPEVMEVWRVAGDTDDLLKVVVRDVPTFDAFHRRLTEEVDLCAVSSRFAMERVPCTTALPPSLDPP